MRKMCKDCIHETVCGSPHTEHTMGCDYWMRTDVVPVVHAHWIRTNSGKWRCSRCRGRHDRPKRYCGECGARMNEQKEGDNGD